MPTYIGRSEWRGTAEAGGGLTSVGSNAFVSALSAKPQKDAVTNPEELVGVALAACYTVMLSEMLDAAGYEPRTIHTSAAVELWGDNRQHRILQISINVGVDADDLDEETLNELAKQVDAAYPISQALARAEIRINAYLARRDAPS